MHKHKTYKLLMAVIQLLYYEWLKIWYTTVTILQNRVHVCLPIDNLLHFPLILHKYTTNFRNQNFKLLKAHHHSSCHH